MGRRREDDWEYASEPRGRGLQRFMDGFFGLFFRAGVGAFRMVAGLLFQVLWGIPYRFVTGWWHAVRGGAERRRMVQLTYGAPALAGAFAVAALAGLVQFAAPGKVAERYQSAAEKALATAGNDTRSEAWNDAKLLYQRLRMLNPQNAQHTLDLVRMYEKENNGASAWKLMQQLASRGENGGAAAYLWLAQEYLGRPNKTPLDWQRARDNLEKLLGSNPDHPGANAAMGRVQAQLGNAAAAERHFVRAVRGSEALKIDHAEFLYGKPERRAECVALGQAAAIYFRQQVNTSPREMLPRMGLARAEAVQNRFEDALKALTGLPPDTPNLQKFKAMEGQLLVQWGLTLPAGDPERWQKLAAGAEKLDHAPHALAVLLKLATETAPDEASFRTWLAAFAAKNPGAGDLLKAMFASLRGPPEEVAKGFAAAAAKDGDRMPKLLRSIAQLGNFRPGTVIDWTLAANAHWPRHRDLESLRARALVQNGRYTEAKPVLEELLGAAPADPGINGMLAFVYDRLAMPQEAERCRKFSESGLNVE
jgi:hypothetical protein